MPDLLQRITLPYLVVHYNALQYINLPSNTPQDIKVITANTAQSRTTQWFTALYIAIQYITAQCSAYKGNTAHYSQFNTEHYIIS